MISKTLNRLTPAPMALFELAFRPGFLGASLYSCIALLLWVLILQGQVQLPAAGLTASVWHLHEMVFGFAALVAMSFLLTASQTWTQLRSLHGPLLGVWCVLWLAVRVLLWQDNVSLQYTAFALQLGWWLLGIGFLAQLLYRAGNRNLMLLPLLSIMMLVDISMLIADITGHSPLALHLGRTSVLLFALLAGILGGRLIPLFTRSGSQALARPAIIVATPKLTKVLIACAISTNLYAFSAFFTTLPFTPGYLMILLGGLQLAQLYYWDSKATLTVPLLWSLHLTYGLLGLGFILLGISFFTQSVRFADALHVIAIGAIGGMILAIMSRVSLGHTGRPMKAAKLMSLAFFCMLLATLVRFLLPSLGFPLWGWQLSAAFWVSAFVLFLWHYVMPLITPRVS